MGQKWLKKIYINFMNLDKKLGTLVKLMIVPMGEAAEFLSKVFDIGEVSLYIKYQHTKYRLPNLLITSP